MTSARAELQALLQKWRKRDAAGNAGPYCEICANELESTLSSLLEQGESGEPDWWLVPTPVGLQVVKNANGYKPASPDAIPLYTRPGAECIPVATLEELAKRWDDWADTHLDGVELEIALKCWRDLRAVISGSNTI